MSSPAYAPSAQDYARVPQGRRQLGRHPDTKQAAIAMTTNKRRSPAAGGRRIAGTDQHSQTRAPALGSAQSRRSTMRSGPQNTCDPALLRLRSDAGPLGHRPAPEAARAEDLGRAGKLGRSAARPRAGLRRRFCRPQDIPQRSHIDALGRRACDSMRLGRYAIKWCRRARTCHDGSGAGSPRIAQSCTRRRSPIRLHAVGRPARGCTYR